MPYSKIQPQQLQLPTFLSHSGDITFTDQVTGVNAILNRTLDGDFNFPDSLTIASKEVITSNASNNTSSSSIALGGASNTVTGANNVLVNGLSNTAFSGEYNVLLNGASNDFGASGQNNTIVAGKSVVLGDKTTGCVIIADHKTPISHSTNESLLINFASGTTIAGGDVSIDANFEVTSPHSGRFFGNTHFDGSAEFDGPVVFDGGISMNGNVVSSVTFQGPSVTCNSSAEFNAPITGNSTVTLSDGTEAASQGWAGIRVAHNPSSYLVNTHHAAATRANQSSKGSVIAGVAEIVTGYIITGYNSATNPAYKAHFVVETPSFTGALKFDYFNTSLIDQTT
jgi:uncharacterized Zn-binding protein involved in type VI secretion